MNQSKTKTQSIESQSSCELTDDSEIYTSEEYSEDYENKEIQYSLFEERLKTQPFQNNFIERLIKEGNVTLFDNILDSDNRLFLEFSDQTTGNTLLHLTTKYNQIVLLKKFVELFNSFTTSVQIVKVNLFGMTPLMIAIEEEHVECALFLLTCGINNLVGIQNRTDGKSALHFLAESKIESKKKALIFNLMHLSLEQINCKTYDGDNAFDLAMFNENNEDLIRMLLQRGVSRARKYIGPIKTAGKQEFSIEKMKYRHEIDVYEEEKKKLSCQSHSLHVVHDKENCYIRLKSFLKKMNNESSLTDWKKVFFLKQEMDKVEIFGENTIEQPEYQHYLKRGLIDFEREEFSNKLKIMVKRKKESGLTIEELSTGKIENEHFLNFLLELKDECIQRLDEKKARNINDQIFLQLNKIVF